MDEDPPPPAIAIDAQDETVSLVRPSFPFLLAIPRELRDKIYHEFLLIGTEKGYVYDFESGKLRTADNKAIDLRPMYACRQIAAEMSGLPLRLHTITFKTMGSKTINPWALGWDTFVMLYWTGIQNLIDGVTSFWSAVADMSDEEQAACGADQRFKSRFQQQENQRKLLRYLAEKSPAIESFIGVRYWTDDRTPNGPTALVNDHNPTRFLDVGAEPWLIPTRKGLQCMIDNIPTLQYLLDRCIQYRHHYGVAFGNPNFSSFSVATSPVGFAWSDDAKHPRHYRFSAAAGAIRFLNSIPPSTRSHIRDIYLDEDRPSVAYPETHARGLVPFCKENPRMRIERRVLLWDTIWSKLGKYSTPQNAHERRRQATKTFADWLNEAVDLPPNFRLVLGLKHPNFKVHTCKIFTDIIQRDAAYQVAFDSVFHRDNKSKLDILCRPPTAGPQFGADFPALLRTMGDDDPNSRIRCEFPPGRVWPNVPGIVAANRGYTQKEWVDAWLDRWTETSSAAATLLETPGDSSMKLEAFYFCFNVTTVTPLAETSLKRPQPHSDWDKLRQEIVKWRTVQRRLRLSGRAPQEMGGTY